MGDPEKKAAVMLQCRDGWLFERAGTGVKILRVAQPVAELEAAIVLSAEEWASVVASVSVAGETRDRRRRALKFHLEER